MIDLTTDEYAGCLTKCPHLIVDKCPWCQVHWHPDAVFYFSHGRKSCGCGFTLTPTLAPVKKK